MWIPVTLFAAGFQTARTAMQQRLRALLSVSGAGFVRYVYGAPLSLSAVALAVVFGVDFPHMPAHFWPIIAAAGTAQIVGTICLIRAFDARDFAIGTVYSKTEVVQVAVFSLVFLGESLRPAGWLAVAVCMLGIVVLATKGRRLTLTDCDARGNEHHPDSDSRQLSRRSRARPTGSRLQTLAIKLDRWRAQRVWFGMLGNRIHHAERGAGAHLWSDRIAVHLRGSSRVVTRAA
jgi:multidrug transporter EmrE-like cation transporter